LFEELTLICGKKISFVIIGKLDLTDYSDDNPTILEAKITPLTGFSKINKNKFKKRK
jgi:hypothetical protein